MGLDSVELLVKVEEKFGISISDPEAATIYTVGDLANSVFTKVNLSRNQKCLSQIVYYRLRYAFVKLRNTRENIGLDSPLVELLPQKDLNKEWDFIQNTIELNLPELVKLDYNKELNEEVKLFGIRIYKRTEPITNNTIRKLVDWILSLNFEELISMDNITSKYEVERIVCGIISDHMGIPVNEIELEYSITNDLGID